MKHVIVLFILWPSFIKIETRYMFIEIETTEINYFMQQPLSDQIRSPALQLFYWLSWQKRVDLKQK